MTTLFDAWPELARAAEPERRRFRAELRRLPGPIFRVGARRGVFRPHVLRCGLCNGWSSYARADLRAWSWSATDGTVHRRCELARHNRGGDSRHGRDERGALVVQPGRIGPAADPPSRPESATLELDGRSRRERRRRRGRARSGRQLQPWSGPDLLRTGWGDRLVVLGASLQGAAVLVVGEPDILTRRVEIGGRESVVRYAHQDRPHWRQLRELAPEQ